MNKEERKATLVPVLELYPDCTETWYLTIDFYPQARAESRGLPLEGAGSFTILDYLEAAKERAAEYCRENNLTISDDRSTVAEVRMIVFRPEPSVSIESAVTSRFQMGRSLK